MSPFFIFLVVSWLPLIKDLSDLLQVIKVSENIFLIISLHCMKDFVPGEGNKRYEIRTKTEQEQ